LRPLLSCAPGTSHTCHTLDMPLRKKAVQQVVFFGKGLPERFSVVVKLFTIAVDASRCVVEILLDSHSSHSVMLGLHAKQFTSNWF